MLKVILLCGVRVSECLNIKCEDITVLPSKEELPSIYKIGKNGGTWTPITEILGQ
jgi:integrase